MSNFLTTVSHFFDYFLHGEAPPPPPEPSLTPEKKLEQTANELGQSLGALNELARSLQARYPTSSDQTASGPTRAELEQQAMAACHERMRQAILKAHLRLGTGLDAEALQTLDHGMEEIVPHLGACVGEDISKRVTSCSLHRVFYEVGVLSWNRLLELMNRQKIEWPAPSGMSPTAGPDEIAAAIERNRTVDGQSFLDKSPAQVRELMQGVIKVWRAVYPSEDSGLWAETVWQGVAAGLRVQLFEKAVQAVLKDQELMRAIQELLESELKATRDILSRGLQSSAELNEVLASTDRLCRQQVPDLVWRLVQPLVLATSIR